MRRVLRVDWMAMSRSDNPFWEFLLQRIRKRDGSERLRRLQPWGCAKQMSYQFTRARLPNVTANWANQRRVSTTRMAGMSNAQIRSTDALRRVLPTRLTSHL